MFTVCYFSLIGWMRQYLSPELGTFEWWISRLMIDPLFFLKGVYAKNERGYRLNAIIKRF